MPPTLVFRRHTECLPQGCYVSNKVRIMSLPVQHSCWLLCRSRCSCRLAYCCYAQQQAWIQMARQLPGSDRQVSAAIKASATVQQRHVPFSWWHVFLVPRALHHLASHKSLAKLTYL